MFRAARSILMLWLQLCLDSGKTETCTATDRLVSDILWWDGINLAMTSLGFMNTQHHIAYHSVLVFELVQALLRLHLIHPVIQFSGRRAKE